MIKPKTKQRKEKEMKIDDTEGISEAIESSDFVIVGKVNMEETDDNNVSMDMKAVLLTRKPEQTMDENGEDEEESDDGVLKDLNEEDNERIEATIDRLKKNRRKEDNGMA